MELAVDHLSGRASHVLFGSFADDLLDRATNRARKDHVGTRACARRVHDGARLVNAFKKAEYPFCEQRFGVRVV